MAGRNWSVEDDARLSDMWYKNIPTRKIAYILGRSASAVQHRIEGIKETRRKAGI